MTALPPENVCLACRQRSDLGQPGTYYTGQSVNGLPLARFFLCGPCQARGFSAERCASCRKPESAELPGNAFALTGPNGPGPQPFWLHNACAPLAGPKQGVTAAYLEELTRQNS